MAELPAATDGRRQAEAVRWQHGLGHAPIRDLFGFLERKYPSLLAVRYPMPGGPAGALVDAGERCVLAVNSAGCGYGRQRFAAGHLLGHFLFDTDRSPLHLDHDLPGVASATEVRADAFAAHLLLPGEVVRERAATPGFDVCDDRQLADLALEYGMCARSLAWHLRSLVHLGQDDVERIAALDVAAVAARMGIGDPVRRERAAIDARGWPGRYLALAVAAYDRRLWTRQQLSEALEDEVLVDELTAGPPSGSGEG